MIDGAQSNELSSSNPTMITPGGDITPLSGNPEETQPRIMPRQMPPGVLRGNIQLGTPNLSVEAANVRILTTDNDGVTRVVMGKLGDNEYGLKVSKPGFDAATASDNDLIFNSGQNVFKIAKIVLYSHTITATDASNIYIDLTIPHGLDFVPQVTGSFTNSGDNTIRLLPFDYYAPATSYFAGSASATVRIDRVDTINIYVVVRWMDALGLSIFLANYPLAFKLYCFQETAGG